MEAGAFIAFVRCSLNYTITFSWCWTSKIAARRPRLPRLPLRPRSNHPVLLSNPISYTHIYTLRIYHEHVVTRNGIFILADFQLHAFPKHLVHCNLPAEMERRRDRTSDKIDYKIKDEENILRLPSETITLKKTFVRVFNAVLFLLITEATKKILIIIHP